MIRTIVIAATLCVAACAPRAYTPPPGTAPSAPIGVDLTPSPATGGGTDFLPGETRLDRAFRAYGVARNVADMVIPYLSPVRAAQVRGLQMLADAAFARARYAENPKIQDRELREATQAAAQLESLTVDSD